MLPVGSADRLFPIFLKDIFMQDKPVSLLPTSWLADRLGLSVTTIERLRSKKSPDLPPHLLIGKSIRYDEAVVERWLASRMQFILAQEEKDCG